MFRTVFRPSTGVQDCTYSNMHLSKRYCLQLASTNVSNLFYFGITLYMFRTVFPSIIRSSTLYIQQQAFVRYCCLLASTNLSILFYFRKTFYMFRTVFPSIIRSSRLYVQQYLFNKCLLLCVQS